MKNYIFPDTRDNISGWCSICCQWLDLIPDSSLDPGQKTHAKVKSPSNQSWESFANLVLVGSHPLHILSGSLYLVSLFIL